MAYDILVGTPGSETASAFTGVPSAVSRVALGSGAWALLHRVNDGWELVPYANHCYHVTLSGPIGAGGAGSVTLPDGRTVDAINWSTDANLSPGDECLCFQDLTDGQFYLIHSGQRAENIAVVSVHGTDPAANCLWPGKVMDASGSPAGGCTNPLSATADCYLLVLNHDGGSWRANKLTLKFGDCYVGRKVFEIEGVPVYAIRHAPKPATVIYRGQISGTLLRGDGVAHVDNLHSFSECPGPSGTIDAANLHHWCGTSGEACYVIEDNSTLTPTYELLSVEWNEVESEIDLTYDAPTLTEHKRKSLGKYTAAETTEGNALFEEVEQTVITAVAYDSGTHELQRTTADLTVLAATSTGTSVIQEATAVEWIEDVSYDTETGLNKTTRTAYMLGDVAGTADDNIVGFTSTGAIYDVTWDGTTLAKTGETLKHLGGAATLSVPSDLFSAASQDVVINSFYDAGTHALKQTRAALAVFTAGAGSDAVVLAATSVQWVDDVTYDSETGLNKTRLTGGYMLGEAGTVGSESNIVGFTSTAAIYSISWSGTTLSATGETIKYLGGSATVDGSATTLFSTTTASLVSNVHFTNPDEMQDFYTVQVFSASAGTTDDVIWSGSPCGGE